MAGRWRRSGTPLVAGLCLVAVLVGACGDDDGDDEGAAGSSTTAATAAAGSSVTTAGGAAPGTVTVKTFSFQPAQLAAKAGTAVTWTNQDETTHTVTAGKPGAPSGQFDQALEGAGKTFAFTFATAGSYSYFCSRHTSMTGEVVVS